MFAWISTFFFAAMVAALPDSTPEVLARSALRSMLARGTAQKCTPNQRLVCCNKLDNCAEIDMSSMYHV